MGNHEHKVPESVPASAPGVLRERKVKPDGSVQEFPLELLGRSSGIAAGRYRLPALPRTRLRVPLAISGGTCSDGYFWEDRFYSVYRFRAPGGATIGHRVDAVADVALGEDSVTYRDLALDWWVLPDGSLIEEDVEEFEALVEAGVFSEQDVAAALEARRTVTERWSTVESELARLEAGWAPDA